MRYLRRRFPYDLLLDAERKTEYIILDDFNIYSYCEIYLNLLTHIKIIQ